MRVPRINQITIAGRLTRDPAIRYANNNMMIAEISLAYDKLTKDEFGNYQTKSNFIDCTAFQKTAETINEKGKKGSAVIIEGSLFIDSYTDKEGVNRKKPDISISKIYFLESNETEHDNNSNTQEQYSNKPQSARNNATHPTGEEDVPF